jgi:hypothetical protein
MRSGADKIDSTVSVCCVTRIAADSAPLSSADGGRSGVTVINCPG